MSPTTAKPAGSVGEVFRAFLILGLTSFGGPIAHLGYFRTELVERRRWLNEQSYADLMAICQFLPGPASSQVGFAIGLMRAGPWGAAAAWSAFTLPSAVAMTLFAIGSAGLSDPYSAGMLHGLKITAVAIVAHAVWGMARSLCTDSQLVGIALLAVFTVVWVNGPLGQVVAIALGASVGKLFYRTDTDFKQHELTLPVSRLAGHIAGLVFLILLTGLPLLVWLSPSLPAAVMDAFYRSGALVFGGGHVVLPLLEAEVVQSGWVSADVFLTGYGAAQAVPGPLFTFASFLGAAMSPLGGGAFGAILALVMIFLPGLLLLVAVLPYWNRFRRWHSAQSLMRGANAAVVGILGAALYQPVWTSTILGPPEFVLALTGFLMLSAWKFPAWSVVLVLGAGGVVITI